MRAKFGTILCAALAVALLGAGALSAQPGEEGWEEFEEAELFFEENITDGDLGLHLKVDGEGWSRMVLKTPEFRTLLDVKVKGNLGRQIGLTELFSESAEPSYDEFPREDFLALFPEGEYIFLGRTLEGDWLWGLPTLTHDIPGEVSLVAPEEDEVVDPDEDLDIIWEPAADPDPPDSVIEFYEVVVEKDEEDERLRVFSIHMQPTDSSVRVPAEFLEPGKEYKVEIVAQETSGNRGSIEVPFATEE